MCSPCVVAHGKSRASQFHKIVTEEEMKTNPSWTKIQSSCCKTHPDKQLDIYCDDCDEVIWRVCSEIGHKTHLCFDLQEAAKVLIEQLKKYCAQLNKCMQNNEFELEQLTGNKTNFMKIISDNERPIRGECSSTNRTSDPRTNQRPSSTTA